MTATPSALRDLLPAAAAFSREAAPRLCGNACRPYHAAWSTLRQIGAITGARTDQDFFQSRIAPLAADSPRVLISGAADYAIAEQVLTAFRSAGVEPEITVADTCATTLAQNRWYAMQVGASMRLLQADIRALPGEAAYDLITTHSVLSFLPADEHAGLFSVWRRLLADGGHVAFVQGFRPHHSGGVLRLEPAEITRFISRAMAHYRADALSSSLDAEAMEALAAGFAAAKRLYVVNDQERLRTALCEAGFSIESWQTLTRDGLPYRSSLADEKDHALSLRVVARAA